MSKADYTNIPLVNNDKGDKKRFEMEVEGHIAYMEYMIVRGNIMYLTHTEVPVALEGRGVGSAIVKKVVQYIRDNQYLMAPLCPFLASYLGRHPEEAKGILAPGFNIG